MAVEFRCDKCGKLLNVEAAPASKVKCPYCKAKVLVPAGVASLPRPQVPPGSGAPPPSPPPVPGQEEEQLGPTGDDAVMKVMAAIMPWLISAFLHIGLMVILAFVYIVLVHEEPPSDYSVSSDQLSDNPGGVLNPGEMHEPMDAKSRILQNQKKWSQRDSTMALANMGQTKSRVQVFGIAGGGAGGQSADFGLTTGGSGAGPKSRFFGTGGSAYHIVYVVDRSGSMIETFDDVRNEMFRSITRLSPAQTFHVIFFASGTPKENPPRRLVYSDAAHKREAANYLRKIQPHGQTDPIPALERAFTVLKNRPGRKRGMLIYLLTDGDFPDNEKVLERIRELNPRRTVHINTILHHFAVPGAMKVLKAIAAENRGRFKFVEPNE